MTRRYYFAMNIEGKYIASPELKGDKEELLQTGSRDTCDLTWEEILDMLRGVTSTYRFLMVVHVIAMAYHSYGEEKKLGVRLHIADRREDVPAADEVYFITKDGAIVLDETLSLAK